METVSEKISCFQRDFFGNLIYEIDGCGDFNGAVVLESGYPKRKKFL